MAKILPKALKLYLVLETDMVKMPLAEFIRDVVDAGVTAIQLRDKFASSSEKLERAFIIKDVLQNIKTESRPLFIINDRADIAYCSGADGVHLGIKDIHPKFIREKFPNLIIGYSCNTVADSLIADKFADYAGIGPAFPTSTKKDLRQVIGVNGISNICTGLHIPSVAIGGINSSNAREVLLSGVSGLAVSSYICGAYEPSKAVAKILECYR